MNTNRARFSSSMRRCAWAGGFRPLRLVGSALLALGLALPAQARQVCDPAADPDFAGAVAVDLTTGNRPLNELTQAPLTSTEVLYQFVHSGVTFRFESLSGFALSSFGANGLISVNFGAPVPLLLTVSPPVAAIGLRGSELDGCPGATYTSAGPPLVNEPTSVISCNGGSSCAAPPSNPRFFGAAGIGPIGTVNVGQPNSIFDVTELVFVPPGGGGPQEADLSVAKSEANDLRVALNGDPIQYQVDVANNGPDDAPATVVTDFLPKGIFNGFAHNGASASFDPALDILNVTQDPLAAQGAVNAFIDATAPVDPFDFSCNYVLTNVAVAGSGITDPDLSNNLATHSVAFDNAAVRGDTEVCTDGIDNNCDGRVDCADQNCTCVPTLPVIPAGDPRCGGGLFQGIVVVDGIVIGAGCGDPQAVPAPQHECRVPRGRCGGVTVPAFCCDPHTWSDPRNTFSVNSCGTGVQGCAPVDPNYKESVPGTNFLGYGYADAGQTMTYAIHYENVGNADALNVRVIDVLDADLDDATLLVNDGGVYDPATRTLVWTDPVVPPATPRQVSFEIDVRANAQPGTRVRNVGTIVFPNAAPPSRIDTNFVEHVVPDPTLVNEPILSVLGCTETPPGSGSWTVDLLNEGPGFAYNTSATILAPPASVAVVQGVATFSHPDDLADGSIDTVIPNAVTTSNSVVQFDTLTPGDPCAALLWRISYEDMLGSVITNDVQRRPDGDMDGVDDLVDNCPTTYNPAQTDTHQDGVGDACATCVVDTDCSDGNACTVDVCDTTVVGGSCQALTSPEVCDGADNDCDGAVDEGGVCAACDPLSVTASRQGGTGRFEGSLGLGASKPLMIPDTIATREGEAYGVAELAFSSDGAAPLVCSYLPSGPSWLFGGCDDGRGAGDVVEADRVALTLTGALEVASWSVQAAVFPLECEDASCIDTCAEAAQANLDACLEDFDWTNWWTCEFYSQQALRQCAYTCPNPPSGHCVDGVANLEAQRFWQCVQDLGEAQYATCEDRFFDAVAGGIATCGSD